MELFNLENYIEQLNRPNSELLYDEDDICGVTNIKELSIGTKANLVGRTLEKFTILEPWEFIFNRRTSRNGEKISISYNYLNKPVILTEDYCHFRVKKECEKILSPHYLYLFFKNPEFDRYARYNSWGSATEFFNWDDMCDVKIKLPPIDIQNKIVNDYNLIEKRISILRKINGLIENYNIALFNYLFDSLSDEANGTKRLSDYIGFGNGYAFKSDTYCEEGPYRIITIGNVNDGYMDLREVNHVKEISKKIEDSFLLKKGEIVISLTGNIGRTAIVCDENLLLNQRVAKLIPKDTALTGFFYYLFRNSKTKAYLESISSGTAQLNLSTNDVLDTVVGFDEEKMHDFSQKTKTSLDYIVKNINEITMLESLKDKLLRFYF